MDLTGCQMNDELRYLRCLHCVQHTGPCTRSHSHGNGAIDPALQWPQWEVRGPGHDGVMSFQSNPNIYGNALHSLFWACPIFLPQTSM